MYSVSLIFIFGIKLTLSAQLQLNQTLGLLGDIKTLSSCKGQLDDGRYIDLSSLDRPSSPRVTVDTTFTYAFNPCSSLSCGGKDAAVCQEYTGKSLYYIVADQSTATFQLLNGQVIIHFTSTDGTTSRETYLTCNCATSESLKFERERPQNTYWLTFNSKCCCPNGCSGSVPKPGDGGLSFGSILIIIFFVTLTVYCVGGVLFMRFKKDVSGVQMIPNVELWKQVPSDIKGGFSFVIGKVRPQSGYSSV